MAARRGRGDVAPRRGDVVWLHFSPQQGHEQAGRRSALVVSPRKYNQRVGLALFCPITTKVKNYPFEVLLPDGLEVSGVILADQIKSLDWRARRSSLMGSVPREVMDEVRARILPLID